MADKGYIWTVFYSEFADRLLEYRGDRKEMIRKLKTVYENIGMRFPKLEADGYQLDDTDPFTVFGLFNKGINVENRIKIITGLASEFDLHSPIPQSFEGIPLLNNLNAAFYDFKPGRGKKHIENLWDTFVYAIKLAKDDNEKNREKFCGAFNLIKEQVRIKWNITMGLFWIRPYYFLNLDLKNRSFMQQKDAMPSEVIEKVRKMRDTVPKGEEYLELVDSCKKAMEEGNYPYKDFPSLSAYAYSSKNVEEQQTNSVVGDKLFNVDDKVKKPEEPVVSYPTYTAEDILREVYISKDEYNKLTDLLIYKKNIILQGPPGVGKTFLAKRLAYSIMGEKDVDRVQMVQFHQSYSYEDFIMGFRPTAAGGFELKKGVFYTFCKKAMEDSDREYFFIIDEINRGNLSKIFGELFMLIEADKRGNKNKIQLLYTDELFYVPWNVYIIGMMNTADRSLAMLDYALRRRFAFFDLRPAFSSDGFREYQNSLDNQKFDLLVKTVEQLNRVIASDESLGEGFCIGHSYFCNMQKDVSLDSLDERLSNLVEYELIPLLKEYWFDETGKVREWSERLRSAIK